MGMPSGRTIATGYDSSGRPISVKGTLGANSTHYVSSVSYAPQGAPSSISLANGAMTQQTCFNSLLQPVVLRLRTGQASCGAADGNDIGYFGYTFSATQNNGNVLGQAIQYGAGQSYASKSFQQTYSYTANRLMGVTETYSDAFTQGSSFTQSYQYDVVGKRWVSAGLVTDPFTPQGNVYDGNNHMSSATYGDGRGNVTQIGGYAYGYDAENRLISSTLALPGNTISSATYTYDGDGRRVVKQSNGTTTNYVYDADGRLVAEYVVSGTGTPALCTTCYLMADHLGNTRLMTDSAGNQQMLYDYAPYGEELTTQGSRDARWGGPGAGLHFTGKEQEGSEGDYMHYFGARYYSAGLGRFTGGDRYNAMLIKQNMEAGGLPAAAATSFFNGYLENPQNWNQYAYVRNNPLNYTDPTGAAPDGHHLIIARSLLENPLARDFASAIKTGPLSGSGFPNQPGYGEMHREYNAAVEDILQRAEEVAGDRNTWSLPQWKLVANQILNSGEAAIKDFLDELETNNPGAKAALGTAISGYRVSVSLVARLGVWSLANRINNGLLILFVDIPYTPAQKLKKLHENVEKVETTIVYKMQ